MTSSSLPLTTTMGSKVMKMVTMMTATTSHLALQIAMDGRECLWEIACADNSWLTQAALNHGLPARRINYKQGFDLYKKSAWMEMERQETLALTTVHSLVPMDQCQLQH